MNRTRNKAGPIEALQNYIRGGHLAYLNINAILHILVNKCKGG